MRSAVLLPLVACGPLGETGEPDGASACLSNASAELHEEIGALVRVRWRQACAGDAWVEYAIDGDDWERSLVRSRAEGEQEQLVVGVPFDADVRVRVAVDVDGDVGRSGVVEAHTGPIPTEVLRPDLLAADPARWTMGQRLQVAVAGSHEVTAGAFVVEGTEALDLPGGRLEALRLVRAPAHPWDLRWEAWFAPGAAYAPVRLRLTTPAGDATDLQWSGTDSR